MSQPDFLYELFEDFMDDPANQDFFNGQRSGLPLDDWSG